MWTQFYCISHNNQNKWTIFVFSVQIYNRYTFFFEPDFLQKSKQKGLPSSVRTNAKIRSPENGKPFIE
jgi:hypothetical protein